MKTSQEKTVYELMVICSGDMSESDFANEFESIGKMIKELGDVVHKENWGARKLPVKIKKFARGYFGLMNFTVPTTAIKDIRESLHLNALVLRSLIIIVPADYKFGSYTDEVIPLPVKEDEDGAGGEKARSQRKHEDSVNKKPRMPIASPKHEPAMEAPKALTQEEQAAKLKKVEKKLEDILDNPDLDI